MAIIVKTENPKELLQAIYEAIDKKEIKTWECDRRKWFTHSEGQFSYKAWFKPTVRETSLRFDIVPADKIDLTLIIYAYYHGHFIQMLLSHFYNEFTSACARPD